MVLSPGDDILLDGVDVPSSSVVLIAFGFDGVASWCVGLVNDGTRMYYL